MAGKHFWKVDFSLQCNYVWEGWDLVLPWVLIYNYWQYETLLTQLLLHHCSR